MASWLWIVIIVVLVAIALAAVMAARRRRTTMLRERFGTEYDRTLDARDGQRAAEADLRGREREHARLDIRPLSEASRARYAGEWRAAQQSFVDQPEEATAAAYDLVNRVMAERGYPMRDFDARADLVSVDHPDVVENYRVAHGIHERAQHQQASTEDLREAMIRYRSLFEELLGADGDAAMPTGTGPAGARHADEEPASTAPPRPASDEPARSRTARDGEVSDDAR
jgi:FtsZ-interacting cell division protein ZipA